MSWIYREGVIEMQIQNLDEVTSPRRRTRPQRINMGIFESFVMNEDVITQLICMGKGKYATVSNKELGSIAETGQGMAYGLNKVFVAAKLPLKARRGGGVDNVIIYHTGTFSESNYATKEIVSKRNVSTAYEQPSIGMIRRVQTWLFEHEDVKELISHPEQCEEIAKTETGTVTAEKAKTAMEAMKAAKSAEAESGLA